MAKEGIKAGRAFVELLADDAKLQKGLKRAQVGLRSFKRQVDQLGNTLMAMGTAVATPLGLSAKIFADYADQISLVRAVAKGTKEELDALDATAKRLGATTSFTAGQVAALMVELGRGGMAAAEINAATQGVLDLARATGTETGTTAGIVVSALRAFQLEASESQRVADVLTAAANGSFNTLQTLGEAFTYAGVSAAQAGMSIEETAAILMALGNVGIQGSMAGTTLRRLLTINAAEARKLQEIFGVTFRDAAGNARPLVDVFEEINAAMEGLGSGERAAKMNEAFGLLGITGAEVIANSADQIRQFTAELENAEGTARRVAQDMDDNLGGSLRMMMSAIEGVAIAIGESLSPTLREWAKQIETSSGGLRAWIKDNEETIVTLATVTAGVLAAGAGLKVLGVILGGFAMAAGGAIKVVKGLHAALTLLAAHPLIAGVGIVAAIATWALFADQMGSAVAEAEAFAASQTKLREEGDKLRQQHQALFDRLKALNEAESLTASHHEEAAKIVATLTEAYGDLGLEIDHTTGKLMNLAGAQERLTEAQRARRIVELEAEIAGMDLRERALMDAAGKGSVVDHISPGRALRWMGEVASRAAGLRLDLGSGDPGAPDAAQLVAEEEQFRQIQAIRQRRAELRRQMEELRAGRGKLWEEELAAAAETNDATGERVKAEAQVVEQLKAQRDLMKEMQAFERGRRHAGEVADIETEIARLEAELTLEGPELEERLLEIEHERQRREHERRQQLSPEEQQAQELLTRRQDLEQWRQMVAQARHEMLAGAADEHEREQIEAAVGETLDNLRRQLADVDAQLKDLPDPSDRLARGAEIGELIQRRQELERQLLERANQAGLDVDRGQSRGTFSAAAVARGALSSGSPAQQMIEQLKRLNAKQEEVRRAIVENAPKVV